MFPACRDCSDADSAVTSVYVAHKHIERAHPAWKRVHMSLENHPYSSFYWQRLEKSQNKLSVSFLFLSNINEAKIMIFRDRRVF